MNILLLANTAMAGAPCNLSSIINSYTEHDSMAILRRYFTSPELTELKWPYTYVGTDPEEIQGAVDTADVIIQNQKIWQVKTKKPQFIIYHAQPHGYQPGVHDPTFAGRKMVVAQYQARYYTDAKPVPNLIDIWKLKPAPKSEDKVKIFMGIASETKEGWGRKGSSDVKQIFARLKTKYRDKVETVFMQGKPIEEVYKEKANADIVIDDIITGSAHISSIEGLSFGAVTINNIDDKCLNLIKEITGSKINPYVKATVETLQSVIDSYIIDRVFLRQKQKESREWAEKYWDPKKLINIYLDFIKERI